jgi:hypothetical protein
MQWTHFIYLTATSLALIRSNETLELHNIQGRNSSRESSHSLRTVHLKFSGTANQLSRDLAEPTL